MTALPPFLAAGCAVLLLWLLRATWRSTRARAAARAGYFAAVAPLFDRVTTRIAPTGFARMTGHIGPDGFDLQAVPDALTFRKLPALWVLVTLPGPLPLRATLDIMARPTGQEPFSHFSQLPQSLPCPQSLPRHRPAQRRRHRRSAAGAAGAASGPLCRSEGERAGNLAQGAAAGAAGG